MNHDKNWMPEYTGPFKELIPEYINFKRSQGYAFGEPILYKLREMDLHFQSMGIREIKLTREMYESYTSLKPDEKEINVTKRLSAFRGFAKYLRSLGYSDIYTGDDDTRIFKGDFIPYVFSEKEIKRMFCAMHRECMSNPCRRTDTFRMVIMLYYCCGLRKSEAQDMKIRDVDFQSGKLSILHGKNDVSRIVPVSDSVREELCSYKRKYLLDKGCGGFLFSYAAPKRIGSHQLYADFHKLLTDAGIPPRTDGRRQRLHDLRHTFCVHTLEIMQKKEFDLYTSLPLLSAYLGHKHITETEYYLRMMEEHFGGILEKTADYTGGIFPDTVVPGNGGAGLEG